MSGKKYYNTGVHVVVLQRITTHCTCLSQEDEEEEEEPYVQVRHTCVPGYCTCKIMLRAGGTCTIIVHTNTQKSFTCIMYAAVMYTPQNVSLLASESY